MKAILLLLGCLLAGTVLAQDGISTQSPTVASGSTYQVQLGAGLSFPTSSKFAKVYPLGFGADATLYTRLSNTGFYLGPQVAFKHFRKEVESVNAITDNTNLFVFTMAGKLHPPLGFLKEQPLSLTAEFGYGLIRNYMSYETFDFDSRSTVYNATGNFMEGGGLFVGLGVEYALTDNFLLKAKYAYLSATLTIAPKVMAFYKQNGIVASKEQKMLFADLSLTVSHRFSFN